MCLLENGKYELMYVTVKMEYEVKYNLLSIW